MCNIYCSDSYVGEIREHRLCVDLEFGLVPSLASGAGSLELKALGHAAGGLQLPSVTPRRPNLGYDTRHPRV